MKKILIATDFSDAAFNASLYGFHLAKALGAKALLFNAYKVPHSAAGLGYTISNYSVMTETQQRLREDADLLDPKRIVVETACDEGPTNKAILAAAIEREADLIICGMQGSGKNIKRFWGSNATWLSKNTIVPLLVVPEDAKFTLPGVIVFASDKDIDSVQGLPEAFTSFAHFFNSKMYVVKVIKSRKKGYFEVVPSAQKTFPQILNSSFNYAVDKNVTHGLNEFSKKHKADILVIVPHKHDWMEWLVTNTETEDMIFHTHIPLLILPNAIGKATKRSIKTAEEKL